jgi:flagellar basal-body rod protein FlgB
MFDELDKINTMSSFYFERTKVIQGNIANANTPFYKPVDLTFEEVLNNQTVLKTTDERHIQPETNNFIKIKSYQNGIITGYDQNKVNVEEEMAKLAESSIMYKSLVEIMKKELSKMKLAISGK